MWLLLAYQPSKFQLLRTFYLDFTHILKIKDAFIPLIKKEV